jgi:hypothetical protein
VFPNGFVPYFGLQFTSYKKGRKLAGNGVTSVEIFGFHIHKNERGFLKLDSECSDCTVSFRVLYSEPRRSIPEW